MQTSEPTAVVAGDTIAWTKSLPDYPASAGWTLAYRIINSGAKYDVTATADGDDHAVSVTAAVSALWAAGTYGWQATVTKGTERYTVGKGTLTVQPNLAGVTGTGLDTRTSARKILDELEEAYLQYSTNGQGHVQRYVIAGREMVFRSATDFIKLIEYWRSRVSSEDATESIAQGLGNPRRLYARFS